MRVPSSSVIICNSTYKTSPYTYIFILSAQVRNLNNWTNKSYSIKAQYTIQLTMHTQTGAERGKTWAEEINSGENRT